jgi:hypothetical protein
VAGVGSHQQEGADESDGFLFGQDESLQVTASFQVW